MVRNVPRARIMAAFHSRIFILTLLLLPATFAEGTQPPPPKSDERKPKTDLYGDPLPPGAIARCGTMRLRLSNSLHGVDAAFAPDGKTFATKEFDALRLWDAKTGKLLWELAEKRDPQMRFGREGKQIAMLGEGGSVCIVDATTGKLLRRFSTASSLIDLSPEGKRLAISDRKDEVTLWDPATGKQLLALGSQLRQLAGGVFTADTASLVTVSDGGIICYWDATSGKLTHRHENIPKMRHSLLSQDGKLIAVMPLENGPITVWDTKAGKQRCVLKQDEKDFCAPRQFTPDGRTLVTSQRSPNNQEVVVMFWDTETGKLLRRLTLPESDADVALLSPDEKTLLTHSEGIVHLWDAVTGKPRLQYPAHDKFVWSLAFTRDGKRLVSGAWDGDIRIWDAATGKNELTIKSHKWGVLGLALSHDDKTVLSGGYDGTVRLHELATGKERWRFEIAGPPKDKQRFENLVYQVAITPDGKSVLSFTHVSAYDALIHKLDFATGKELQRRAAPYVEFRHASFSNDGRLLPGIRARVFGRGESASDRKVLEEMRGSSVVMLQDVATGRELFSALLPDFSGPYHQLTPDDRMIVTSTNQLDASKDYRLAKSTLRFWEVASGKERVAIDLPLASNGTGIGRPRAVSEDCRTLAVSRYDLVHIIWDLASGRELLRRGGFASQAGPLAFSPDGKRLASAHRDGTILIWDLLPEIDRRPSPPNAEDKNVDRWWTALAGDDAKQAHAAIWGLIGAPERTLPLFRERLHPAEAPPAEKLKQLLGDLDSDEFAKRNAAAKQLAEFEELAEPAMREALKEDISAEKRKRLEKLLDITLIVRTPEKLRQLRALEVLEQIGTPEARQLLAKLANGTHEARLTRDAKAALQRLERP
jgi:WD40 repeat protein